MASYASTTSHLRTSVFDAAFEIGLADPRLTEWLESVPESPTEKTPPVASQGNQHWSLSSGSSTSHGSLTTIASESSQSSPVRHDIHTRSPAFDLPQQRTPDTMMPNSRYPSPILSPPTPRSHPVVVPPIVFPSPPEPEPETSSPLKKPPKRLVKLTRPLTPKKSGQPDKVKSRDTEEKRSADDDRVHYDFLDTEPPTDSDKKDHRSFFGRLRDRSRSKSRMRKKDDHRANDNDASRRSDESKDLAQHDGRGRDVSCKPVQAVIVTQNGGAPQLQLTQPNNRQSSDLLKALNAQLGTTSLAPGSAYLADLKIALPPSPTTPKQSVKLAVGPGTGPRPRVSVMDRPHPKIRTSGYFVNRDRGVPVSRGGTSRVIHVGRKTTASRKISIRGTAGASSAAVKRAASGRRLALGNSGSASPRGFNRRGSRAIKLTEEQEAEIAEVEAEAITKPDEMPAAEAGRSEERPDPVNRPNLVLQIPVIIERQASIKRQPKPDPPSFNGLRPSLPKPSNSLSPSPSTSARSLFGVRLRRFSHNNLPPSPLKPPTSPLPPTPSVPVSPGQSMTPSLPSRSVSPTPPRSPGANSDGGESHWFEDDSSDEDSAPIVISQLPRRREGDFPETPTSMNPSVDDTLRLSTGSAFSQPRQAPTPPVAPRDGHPSPATRPTLQTLTLPEPRPRLSPSPSPLGRRPEMPIPSPRSDAAPYPLATRVLSNTPEPAPSPSPVANAPAGSSTNVRFAGEAPEPERSTTPAPSAWNAKALMGSILKPSALKKGRKDGAPAPIEIPSITPAGSAAPTPSFLSVPPETGRTTPNSALSRTSSISSVSGAQRGRTTPFPARPVPPLSRSPSVAAMRRRVDEGSIYGDGADRGRDSPFSETGRRQSSDSNRTGSEAGHGSGSSIHSGDSTHSSRRGDAGPSQSLLKRKPSVVNPIKVGQVERYNNMPLSAFIPATKKTEFESKEVSVSRSASPISRGPSPPVMPRMPSLLRHTEAQAKRSAAQALRPALRTSPVAQPSRMSLQSVASAPRPSGLARQDTFPPTNLPHGNRDSMMSRSIYSIGDGDSDSEDGNRFGLDYEEDTFGKTRGLSIIAAKYAEGSLDLPPTRALQIRKSISPVPSPLPTPVRSQAEEGPRVGERRDVERHLNTLAIPGRSASSRSPSPSPMRSAGAGGAGWI